MFFTHLIDRLMISNTWNIAKIYQKKLEIQLKTFLLTQKHSPFMCVTIITSSKVQNWTEYFRENLGYAQSYLFNCFVTYFKWNHRLFVWNKQIYQIFRNKAWISYSSQTKSGSPLAAPLPPWSPSWLAVHGQRLQKKNMCADFFFQANDLKLFVTTYRHAPTTLFNVVNTKSFLFVMV